VTYKGLITDSVQRMGFRGRSLQLLRTRLLFGRSYRRRRPNIRTRKCTELIERSMPSGSFGGQCRESGMEIETAPNIQPSESVAIACAIDTSVLLHRSDQAVRDDSALHRMIALSNPNSAAVGYTTKCGVRHPRGEGLMEGPSCIVTCADLLAGVQSSIERAGRGVESIEVVKLLRKPGRLKSSQVSVRLRREPDAKESRPPYD
jgi:hypothetical protein